MDWKFDQGENVAALTTKQVMKLGFPVLQVIHYSDDHSWAFMCGTTADSADALMVSMAQVLSVDATLHEIAELPPGWIAERESVGADWTRQRDDEV